MCNKLCSLQDKTTVSKNLILVGIICACVELWALRVDYRYILDCYFDKVFAFESLDRVISFMFRELWPLLLTWFNFNPAWIRNYMPGKMWGEVTYLFLNFNGATVEV